MAPTTRSGAVSNRIVPPSQQQQNVVPPARERTEQEDGYDLIEQLKRTPARISIAQLLQCSPSHWQALLDVLKNAWVQKDIPPESLG